MHEIRIRTPAIKGTLATLFMRMASLLITLAFFTQPLESRAAADDITVTMDVQIALTLDKSNLADKKMTGEGTVYGSCVNGASHGFVRASVPDSLTMATPAGNMAAPDGTQIDFTASINARKGRANYEAKNGLNGKSLSDLMKGKMRVTVPLTEDFLDYGAGSYSIRIPITFTMTKAYGSYDENLNFTPWETLIEEGKVTVEDGRLKAVEKGDVILEMTQIGKECHADCAIRKQVGDCVMPREGIFTIVIEEGTIRAGDPVEICED